MQAVSRLLARGPSFPGPMYSIYETSRAFLALREEGNQSTPTCYSNALYAQALAEYPYHSVVHRGLA